MHFCHSRLLAGITLMIGIALGGPTWASTNSSDELDAKISQLIKQLGDKEYAIRHRAQQALTQIGLEAFDALCEAEDSDDVEIAAQARYLVGMIRSDWTAASISPKVREILADYDLQNETSRLARMKLLLKLPGDAGVEALCRLVRIERPELLSKQAALLLINQDPQPNDAAWEKRKQLVNENLGKSPRTAARWLKAYLLMRSDPQAAVDQWSKLIEAEKQTLDKYPQQSDSRLLMQLMRIQVAQLDVLKRSNESFQVIQDMLAIEHGDPQSVNELVDWLAQRRAWNVIEEVAKRFSSTFETDPRLLYTLAQALHEEDRTKEAEEVAQRALRLNPDQARQHFETALLLQTQGLLEWSDREYRYIISVSNAFPEDALLARVQLAESLHDRQLDREAGETLQGFLDAVDKNQDLARLPHNRRNVDLRSKRSRTLFFFACHELQEGNPAKAAELLDQAIKHDETDADVLIALYQLPDQEPARRERTLTLLKNAIQAYRNELDDDPDQAQFYNQLAWVIANTEGNFDEAIRLSQKSVEIVRANVAEASVGGQSRLQTTLQRESLGGYLDTLGHCYAAKKDYENAVKTQTEAISLSPHSQQIGRKLILFNHKLTEMREGKIEP